MPSQNINGTTLSYEERGSGDPLVLLHGFPLDARMWEAQLADLGLRYRVIAPDLRGFGKSRAGDAFTMQSLAENVHELLEAIGALPFVLAGLSMGGYVALEYVKKYPTDLKGLILIDTKAEGDSPEARAGRQKMIDLVRASGATAVAEQMLPKMLARDADPRTPQAQDLRRIMEACPPQTIEHALVALRDRADHTGNLPSVPVPTLVLVGDTDAITPPAGAEAMTRQIPSARLIVIRGAGHMSPMEQPSQVNQAIREFVEQLR